MAVAEVAEIVLRQLDYYHLASRRAGLPTVAPIFQFHYYRTCRSCLRSIMNTVVSSLGDSA